MVGSILLDVKNQDDHVFWFSKVFENRPLEIPLKYVTVNIIASVKLKTILHYIFLLIDYYLTNAT